MVGLNFVFMNQTARLSAIAIGDMEKVESAWKGIDNFANKIYDPKADTWTACTPFDPNNHQTFAGKTMLFQNQSGRELTNVKAVFYEKTNGILQPVETIYWETIAAGQRVSFKIPKKIALTSASL